jgi:hypothetical protein
MFRFDPANTGFNPFETTISTANAAQLTSKWTAITSGQTNRVFTPTVAGGTGSPAVANGVLYLTASGNVEAFDAATGGFPWDGDVVYPISSAVVTGGMVYANVEGTSTGTLHA